jgi:hypothetical protein
VPRVWVLDIALPTKVKPFGIFTSGLFSSAALDDFNYMFVVYQLVGIHEQTIF